MCSSCTKVVVGDTKFVEQNKLDFEKCSKHISVQLPAIKINKYLREEDIRFLLLKAEENNEELVKLHYLQTDDDSFRPYHVLSDDFYLSGTKSESSQADRLVCLTFLAQYQLRYIVEHFLNHMQELTAKKRRRRLQYKQNKKEKGLKTNEPEINVADTELKLDVLKKNAPDCDCMVQ